MALIDKGIAGIVGTLAGAAFIGIVGYKVIEKKNPALLKKAKKSVSGAKERISDIAEGARDSFREGFVSA